MRKIYVSAISLIFFSFVIAGMVSCKKGGFLAPTSVTDLTAQTVFVDSANTNQFLADIYKNIIVSVYASRFGNGGLDAAGDESQPGNTNASIATYWAAGTINAAVAGDDVYKTCYTEIRAVNQLLKNIYKTKLVLPDNQPGSRAQLKAEARFLRAWYYGILVQHYGGVPLIGDTVYNDYTVPITVKRANFASCISYIVSECDSAAKVLPYTQSGTSYGRADGGACQSLKARILLMAASPLFNGSTLVADAGLPSNAKGVSTDSLTRLVGYPDNQVSRWQAAADAAEAVISSGAYGLSVDNSQPGRPGIGFQDLFSQRTTSPNENILQWMLPDNDWPHQLENIWDPPSRSGSSIGGFPYQEMVDAFPMRDGKNIDDNTSAFTYDPQNPYANRDPRLDFTVNHDQSRLIIRVPGGNLTDFAPLDIFLTNVNGSLTGGVDAVGIGTITGYYTNKMLDTTATSTSLGQPTHRCQPLMRFAEIMLDFAEAKNEVDGPGASASGPKDITVYNMLKLLRQRAGILPGSDGLYGLKDNMTKDEMRVAIQHERQIELAYEGFRFWDVRRWKIAPITEAKQFHGMKVIHDNGNVTYNVFPVQPQHSFRPRMYLWPFPQNEIGKSTTLLQNPGY